MLDLHINLNLLFQFPTVFYIQILPQMLNSLISVLVGISMVGMLKNVMELLTSTLFSNQFVYVFKKSEIVLSWVLFSNSYPFLKHYNSVLRRADEKTPRYERSLHRHTLFMPVYERSLRI